MGADVGLAVGLALGEYVCPTWEPGNDGSGESRFGGGEVLGSHARMDAHGISMRMNSRDAHARAQR